MWLARAAAVLVILSLGVPPPARTAEEKPTTPAQRYDVSIVRDVPYFHGPDADRVKHRLDLFLPKRKKDFPVLFFVHGGAWHHGDKSFLGVYSALGTFFARHGIGTVVINYRLSPEVKHPGHIYDVARAFAWTHKNIARYGGHPDQIFLSGHSAGGHLIALLATNPNYLRAEGLSSTDIKGVIPLSGVYDIAPLPPRILRSAFGKEPGVVDEASPLRQVRAKLPPFLILYADHDLPGCDRENAEAFAKALRGKGNEARTREVIDSNHYKMILEAAVEGDPVTEAVLEFVTARTETVDSPAPTRHFGGGGK